MSRKSYNIILKMPNYLQNKKETWDGIKDAYIDNFISDGCALCSLTMLTAYMEKNNYIEPIDLVNRGVTSATSPWIDYWDKASTEFELDKYKKNMSKSNFINKIVVSAIRDRVPVVVQVPGHYVVTNGFSGTLDLDMDRMPIYSTANADMIKINDPYYNENTTLGELIKNRGNIISIFVPSK